MAEHQLDLSRFHRHSARVANPNELHGRRPDRPFEPRVYEIQAEHTEERIEQDMDNLPGLVAAPDRWQSEQADQIINAAMKALNLQGRVFCLRSHLRPPRARWPDESAVGEIQSGIRLAEQRKDYVEECPR